MNYSLSLCDEIYKHKEIQVVVQQYVSELSAYSQIVQGTIDRVLMLSTIRNKI